MQVLEGTVQEPSNPQPAESCARCHTAAHGGQGKYPGMHLCQDSGEVCLVSKPKLGRGIGWVYSFKSNKNRKVFSTILTRDQVTCQLEHMGQVLFLPAHVSISAGYSSIPSLLGYGRSQKILLRNPWIESQPHSGAAMGSTETVIPVPGRAEIHPPSPSLISPCCVQFHPGRHRGPAS